VHWDPKIGGYRVDESNDPEVNPAAQGTKAAH